MPKDAQINIRFDAATNDELEETAAALGVSKGALVRRLTEAFLAEVRRTGAVQIKPAWVKDMAAADARSDWGQRKIQPQAPSPKPQAPSPKPQAPSPKPQAPSPKPQAPSPKPQAPRNPKC